jgi:hypothetical protein
MCSTKGIITFRSSSANKGQGKKEKSPFDEILSEIQLILSTVFMDRSWRDHAFSSSINIIRVSVVTSKCLAAIWKIPWKHGTLVSSPCSWTKYVLVMQVCS